MKNVFLIALIFIALFSCNKPNKIGFVDNGVIINKYQEKIDLEAKFQLKEGAYRNKFDSIDKEFQFEVQKFQLEANQMPQASAQKRYDELSQKKQLQDQQRQVEAQQFQKSFQIELDSIISKVKRFEKQYGKTNGFTYVLGTSDVQATILFGSDENDLTQIILDSLNSSYRVK